MQWISVKKQLPPAQVRVLLMEESGRIFAGYRDKKGVWFASDYCLNPVNHHLSSDKIEYWMDIPK